MLLKIEDSLLQLLNLPAALLMWTDVFLSAESMQFVELYRLELSSEEGRRTVVRSGMQGLVADGIMQFLF